ncbi:type VI secretion system protein TssA [Pseudomonas sp. PA-7-1E]|uniref:type VI secretion system protein TssA n=1 Tax=unclassified Pseudomonas TaxID=196821 RepID=UPI001F2B0374|nr:MULTISPECIES: type VI secretion system protein TssA [unclassified Pseudomonas]MCF5041532.1 type VI secretion system protein TssA [Pseudomonas sp. PA-7-1E]MCF5132091.1 type VI secretion system protein TssA [Pseudomonas sp. PA-6-4F]
MNHAHPLCTHYLQLAKCAISSDDFMGSDLRYCPEFEELESEVGREATFHETAQTDWKLVRERSETFLETQSKDLRVVAWLAWSLFQCESYKGLQAGLAMLRYLISDHWDEIHPQKPRTRAAAVSWLCLRLEQIQFEQVAIAGQLALFRQLIDDLHAIEGSLSHHLGEGAPLLLPLCRRLDELLTRASQGHPEPGTLGAAFAQVKHVAEQLITPGAPVDNEKTAHKTLRTLQDQTRPLCLYWLKQKSSDIRALRLGRTLLWLPIDTLPEHNAEKVTALRGVPIDKLADFQERFAQRQYADLMTELEACTARSPFWLDGQRLTWECLQALQAEHAMREVEIQLALFLQRVPGLEELQFHDGTPFADPQTRLWIRASVLPHLKANEPPPDLHPKNGDDTTAPWEQSLQDALPTLQASGLKAAVQHFKKDMRMAGNRREHFLWQLTLARLSFHAKKYELARVQLTALDTLLHNSGLNDWEPDLVLDVLNLLHTCCELLPQNHEVREHKEEIHRRLCHLDVEVVLD